MVLELTTLARRARRRMPRAATRLVALGCAGALALAGCTTGGHAVALARSSSTSSSSSLVTPAASTAPTSSSSAAPSSTQPPSTPPPVASSDAPGSSGSSADDAAYTAYLGVTRTYLDPAFCRDVRDQFGTAVLDGDATGAHQVAADYRTTLYTADAGLRAVPFPASARSDANDLLQTDKEEIADLDAFASMVGDKMLLAYLKIMAKDDLRAELVEAVAQDLGHSARDEQLAIQWYDDDVRVALLTLEDSFVQLGAYSTDLVQQEGAAMVDGQNVATFQHTLATLPIAPPSRAQADADRMMAAAQALAAELSTDAHAADSRAAGRVKTRYDAIIQVVNTLDTQLGSDMTSASAPDRGCTGITGDAASPSSGASTAGSTDITSSTSVPHLYGTNWVASLPPGWTTVATQSGDDLDLQAPDGGAVSIAKPAAVSSADPQVVGQKEIDALTGRKYVIIKALATGTWAGSPSFKVGVQSADGSVDAILVGVIYQGSVVDITVAVPAKIVASTSDADALDQLQASWHWT